jgi:hypothetical protein
LHGCCCAPAAFGQPIIDTPARKVNEQKTEDTEDRSQNKNPMTHHESTKAEKHEKRQGVL